MHRRKPFIKEVTEFRDERVALAEDLYEQFGNYGPLVVRSDKKSLCFAINLEIEDRAAKEQGDKLYRITIEKV